MASIAGTAHVKMLWKSRSITSPKTATPASGWSSTRSMWSVRVSRASLPAPIARHVSSTQAKRSSGVSAGGSLAAAGQVSGCCSSVRSCSTPTPRCPTTPATRMPRMRDSAIRSGHPPRALASSIMVTTMSVGKPSRSTSRTRPRPRCRVVASATTTSPSGIASPEIRPSSTRATTSSSGVSPASE